MEFFLKRLPRTLIHTSPPPLIHIEHRKKVPYMSNNVIDDRATKLGEYIVENKATVRCAAKQFGVSKSTVHMEETKQNGYYGW